MDQEGLSPGNHLFTPFLFPLDVEVMVQVRGLLRKHAVKQRRWGGSIWNLHQKLRYIPSEHSVFHARLGVLG